MTGLIAAAILPGGSLRQGLPPDSRRAIMSLSLLDLPVVPLLIRMAATAFVVIGVAVAVGRLGPIVGGALAGLPIVLGPGFLFLAMQAPPDFAASAAAYSLLSLCATQLFLLAYIVAARRAGPA